MKVTPRRLLAFCTALTNSGGNITRACEAIDIERMTAYRWRREMPEFAKAWDEAKILGLDKLEDELLRRAHDGVEKPVFYKGRKLKHTIREYSDTLGIFLLKGGKPEKYRERVEHSGSVDLAGRLIAARARPKE